MSVTATPTPTPATPTPGTTTQAGYLDPDHRPSYFDLLARPNLSSAAGQVWLVTFTDLMALMLAFFVLMFSMSQIEQQKWQGLVEALASDLNTLSKVENPKPAIDFQPEEAAVAPGTDLDYLRSIVREQIAAHPLLARATIQRAAERLVISLPAELLFGADTAVPAPQAAVLGSALVSVLRNLDNSVEVEAHLKSAGAARAQHADWEMALARASAFTRVLIQAGYTGRIVARVTAPSGPATSQGARLDVVIHESALELR